MFGQNRSPTVGTLPKTLVQSIVKRCNYTSVENNYPSGQANRLPAIRLPARDSRPRLPSKLQSDAWVESGGPRRRTLKFGI